MKNQNEINVDFKGVPWVETKIGVHNLAINTNSYENIAIESNTGTSTNSNGWIKTICDSNCGLYEMVCGCFSFFNVTRRNTPNIKIENPPIELNCVKNEINKPLVTENENRYDENGFQTITL